MEAIITNSKICCHPPRIVPAAHRLQKAARSNFRHYNFAFRRSCANFASTQYLRSYQKSI